MSIRPPPPPPRTPLGFVYLAAAACMLGLFMLEAFGDSDGGALGRLDSALLAVLGFLSAEALIMARPWAFRITAALAVAAAASLVLWQAVVWSAAEIVAIGIVVVPVLAYVRKRTATLHRALPPPAHP